MKSGGFHLSTIDKVLSWARSSSLWYVTTGGGCCADEILAAMGPRYDLERFGCVQQIDPRQADLLIVTGLISYKAATHLRALYDQMPAPKYVMCLGSCATGGGPFAPEFSYGVVPGADRIVPVDIYVPGCPARPEAIMNGLITLQEKIRGHQRSHPQA
ncbi:NADH-quinone oxidoreductase subunit NuoB [bacterium]|nr:NADH-quinone oxidoreductase subunit NuoB [bacterium]